MSSNRIRFACSALAGTNKVGTLKKDDNGYYELVVGALNVYNSAGQYYVYEEAKNLFTSSSQLQRRISRGSLRGEYGHPKILPGMTNDQFANRVMSIYEENVCCHHKEITIDFDRVKDSNGKPVIAIISKVFPSGPMGPALEKSLNNKNENVAFSIRAFTDDYREGGITKRVLKNIVTWDLVNEPGLAVAEKFQAPALESDGFVFSRGEIERSVNLSTSHGIATESSLITAKELFRIMNWEDNFSNKKPSYIQW